MKTLLKLAIVACFAGISAMGVYAKTTGNFMATSNYLWKGMSFSNNAPALQGGMSHDNGSGLNLSTWASIYTDGYRDGALGTVESNVKATYNHSLSDDFSLMVEGYKEHNSAYPEFRPSRWV